MPSRVKNSMKLALVVLGSQLVFSGLLQASSLTNHWECETLRGKLNVSLTSWLEQAQLSDHVLAMRQTLFDARDDHSLIQRAVDTLVMHHCPQADIEDIFARLDLVLPRFAYIDGGVHALMPGKQSLLGSWGAHAQAAFRSPSRWLMANFIPLVGYVATGSLMFSSIVPAAAATETPLSECRYSECVNPSPQDLFRPQAPDVCPVVESISRCPVPQGNYQDTCQDIVISAYKSPDPKVPEVCRLTARCPVEPKGSLLRENALFYPQGMQRLEHIDVVNGALTYDGASLYWTSETPASESNEVCRAMLHGSFTHSCDVRVMRYDSQDQNLAGAEMCAMMAICPGLDGVHHKTEHVFLVPPHPSTSGMGPHPKSQLLPIENCNGLLVQHPHGEDQKCNGAPVVIKMYEQKRQAAYLH